MTNHIIHIENCEISDDLNMMAVAHNEQMKMNFRSIYTILECNYE